ncbi:hypothetical protein [Chryseobacterium aurantiacum]|uniref:hypothetical protein n=1 Tax=Chryseobacterium aurantiacum TaxID=2116499 RepID=UPI000D122D40|nr:hypothetical protein [Chryseobacterium aurantiacum]
MNKTLQQIINSREDISDYLFHFTNGEKAFDTLCKIYDDRKLIDVNDNGVICFTEAPLTTLTSMFDIFIKYRNPMYSPYGVGIKKEYLFNIGCRPVIYGPKEDYEKLHEDLKWRFEEYKPNEKDFSWLREWRLNSKNLELLKEHTIFITKNKSELDYFTFNEADIIDIEFDGCVADGQFWGEAYGVIERSFKGVSIEEIREINKISKEEFHKILDAQSFDETGGVNLGGFIQ